MSVVGEGAQVMNLNVEQALPTGRADQRKVKRGKVFREDADNVNSHPSLLPGKVEEPSRGVNHDVTPGNFHDGHDCFHERNLDRLIVGGHGARGT